MAREGGVREFAEEGSGLGKIALAGWDDWYSEESTEVHSNDLIKQLARVELISNART